MLHISPQGAAHEPKKAVRWIDQAPQAKRRRKPREKTLSAPPFYSQFAAATNAEEEERRRKRRSDVPLFLFLSILTRSTSSPTLGFSAIATTSRRALPVSKKKKQKANKARARESATRERCFFFAFFSSCWPLSSPAAVQIYLVIFLSLLLLKPRPKNKILTDPRVRAARRALGATRRRGEAAGAGAGRRTTRDDGVGVGGIAVVVAAAPRTAEAPSIAVYL